MTADQLILKLQDALRTAVRDPNSAAAPWLAQAQHALAQSEGHHPQDPSPFEVAKSVGLRLDWCALSLRATADRGRAQLGDGYPEVLSVLGAINASRECLDQLKPS